MKMKRTYLFLLSFLIFVLFTNEIKVEAVNTGFQTNHLTSEEKNTFLSNINILLIDKEPMKNTAMDSVQGLVQKQSKNCWKKWI